MKKALFLPTFILIFSIANAQEWVEKMRDPDVNFYEVQESFEAHWAGKGYERGKGYKQYKRWENFTAPRVYPSGERRHAETFYQAWQAAQSIPGNLQKSDNDWEPVGPVEWTSQGWNPGLGRVNAVVRDPIDPEKLYVATPSGGLWVREGGSWTSLTDHLPSIGASGLAIHPVNTDILYLATGDGDGGDTYAIGVMKSTDGGATWNETGLTMGVAAGERFSRIIMSPDDPDKLWACGSAGLFITENAGETWSNPVTWEVRDIELKPGNPDVVYIAGSNFIMYSEDGGENFANASGLPPADEINRYCIAVTPANPELVYVIGGKSSDSGFHGLYRSENSGVDFSMMSNSPNILTYSEVGEGEGGQSWYDLALAASPTDEDLIFAGGINVWSSSDGGENWQIKSHWVHPSFIGYTHADIHSLDFYGGVLYCGSDGGVFESVDEGDTWTDLSNGLQIAQYYRIAVSSTDPEKILVGSQDNGTNLFTSNNTYTHLLGGDGNAAAIDYTNHNIMYAAYPGGVFQRSTDGGNSFSDITSGITETGAWVTPLELHPTNPDILFAAYENVWKYEAGSWQAVGEIPLSTTLRALEVSPADPEVIYTSTFGNICKTVNGGDQWTVITSNLPNLSITDIETDPENADRVWITLSGYADGDKVFYSSTGGNDWENISLNLPNLPVNCISYLPGSDDGIYIGTDNGVFYKSNESPNWSSYNEGLPDVIVNHIVFQYASQQILIATYGRGVWKNSYFDISNLEPIANFTSDRRLICVSDSISFTNFSLNSTSPSQWFFPGGTPVETSEFSPTVHYSDAGIFDVMLVAANGDLTDTLIFEDYIQVLPAIGETTPFIEDFENLSNLPWIISENEDPLGWEPSDIGFESSTSLMVDNFNNVPDMEEVIESHTFDLSGLDTAIVTMRVAYAKKPDSGLEALRAYVSTDCGETWDFKKVFVSFSTLESAEPTDSYFTPQGPEDWNLLTIDNIEPSERTENFRLRLVFRSNGGNNIFLDDINLTDDLTVGIETEDFPKIDLTIFPNPASDYARIDFHLSEADEVTVTLTDMTGKTIRILKPGRLPSGKNSIDLNLKEFAPGTYLVEILSENGYGNRKLILAE